MGAIGVAQMVLRRGREGARVRDGVRLGERGGVFGVGTGVRASARRRVRWGDGDGARGIGVRCRRVVRVVGARGVGERYVRRGVGESRRRARGVGVDVRARRARAGGRRARGGDASVENVRA